MPGKKIKKTSDLPSNILPYAIKQAKSNNGKFIITDKATKQTYYGKIDDKGNVVEFNQYEVLTGKNDTPRAALNSKAGHTPFNQLEYENSKGVDKNKVTPIGKFKPYKASIYNSPGLFYTAEGVAVHTTYPGELKKRESLYNNNNINDNDVSYGCINGRCGDVKKMVEFFKEGDQAYIIDTRLKLETNMRAIDQNLFYEHPTVNSNKTIPIQNKSVVENVNNIPSNKFEEVNLRTDSEENAIPLTFQKNQYDIDLQRKELDAIGFSKITIPTELPYINKPNNINNTLEPVNNNNFSWSTSKLPNTLSSSGIGSCLDGSCFDDSVQTNNNKQEILQTPKNINNESNNELFNTMRSIGINDDLFKVISNTEPNVSKINSQNNNNLPLENKITFNPNDYPLDLSDVPEHSISGQDNTELVNQISQQNNTTNYDFKKNPLIDNPTQQTIVKTKTTNRPYEGLVNLFDFGLNSLASLKTNSDNKKNEIDNAIINQQPQTNYYNKRMLRGDKVMKTGGQYQIEQEYDLDEEEIKKLIKLGFEIERI